MSPSAIGRGLARAFALLLTALVLASASSGLLAAAQAAPPAHASGAAANGNGGNGNGSGNGRSDASAPAEDAPPADDPGAGQAPAEPPAPAPTASQPAAGSGQSQGDPGATGSSSAATGRSATQTSRERPDDGAQAQPAGAQPAQGEPAEVRPARRQARPAPAATADDARAPQPAPTTATTAAGGSAAVTASFTCTSVSVTSTKDLSNAVLVFADGATQRFEGLSGRSGTFAGTGANAGWQIASVYVKSGANHSGEGSGYGVRLDSNAAGCAAATAADDPGNEPGTDLGNEPGTDVGAGAGIVLGTDPANEPGTDPALTEVRIGDVVLTVSLTCTTAMVTTTEQLERVVLDLADGGTATFDDLVGQVGMFPAPAGARIVGVHVTTPSGTQSTASGSITCPGVTGPVGPATEVAGAVVTAPVRPQAPAIGSVLSGSPRVRSAGAQIAVIDDGTAVAPAVLARTGAGVVPAAVTALLALGAGAALLRRSRASRA